MTWQNAVLDRTMITLVSVTICIKHLANAFSVTCTELHACPPIFSKATFVQSSNMLMSTYAAPLKCRMTASYLFENLHYG